MHIRERKYEMDRQHLHLPIDVYCTLDKPLSIVDPGEAYVNKFIEERLQDSRGMTSTFEK